MEFAHMVKRFNIIVIYRISCFSVMAFLQVITRYKEISFMKIKQKLLSFWDQEFIIMVFISEHPI